MLIVHIRPMAASEDSVCPPEAVGPSRWSEEVVVDEEKVYDNVYCYEEYEALIRHLNNIQGIRFWT